MKPSVSIILVVAALAPIRFAAQDPQQQPTFRTGAKTVAVYATVADKDGRLVPDLARDAFEVRDNGKPQPLTVFASETQPIAVVMLIDRSGSMRGNFGLVEHAAEEFVRGLRPDDKARIGSFSDRIVIQPEEFTSSHEALIGILRSDMPVTGPTPLWNAIDDAMTALRGREGRKVVLVFSDGGDAPANFSFNNRSIMDVMRRAQQDDMMVYAIGLQTTVLRRPSGGGGIGGFTGGMTSVQAGPRSRNDCGRDRRWLLRVESIRGSRLDLRARGGRTAPAVRAGLRAAKARRQDAQAGSASQHQGLEGARAQGILRGDRGGGRQEVA